MIFFNSWLQGIVVAVIITTILELIMPNGNNKKYIKVVLGIYVIFNIIAPIVNSFTGSKLEDVSLLNIEKYKRDIDAYNKLSNNIDINKTNDESVKQIYIKNLENDMKAKLENKGFKIKDIKIKINNSEKYSVTEIKIFLKEETEEKTSRTNGISKIEVRLNYNVEIINEDEDNERKNKITEKQIKKIKEYISDIYEIDEDIISVN